LVFFTKIGILWKKKKFFFCWWMMIIIIDGYNVLQYIAKGSAGPAEKEVFIRKLQEHAQASPHQMIVVFDGGSMLVPARERLGKLTIIHTGHHETADDYIMRLMQKESETKNLMVSSDHQLQSAARRWGAQSMEARTFAELIADPEPQSQRPVTKSGKLITRAGSANDELAAIMEQESRVLPIKEEDRQIELAREKAKQSKRIRKVLKKL
jgi:predicted RNA-binding protein with PIN domain